MNYLPPIQGMDKDVIKKLIVMSQEQDVELVERDMEISFAG